MEQRTYDLNNGRVLLIREAVAEDARAVLDYVETGSGESDFLTFGPGEFELSEVEEEDFLGQCREADNHLYILGLIEETIVATLVFSAGRRPLPLWGRRFHYHLGDRGFRACSHLGADPRRHCQSPHARQTRR